MLLCQGLHIQLGVLCAKYSLVCWLVWNWEACQLLKFASCYKLWSWSYHKQKRSRNWKGFKKEEELGAVTGALLGAGAIPGTVALSGALWGALWGRGQPSPRSRSPACWWRGSPSHKPTTWDISRQLWRPRWADWSQLFESIWLWFLLNRPNLP